jgi:hypothetical protein
LSYTRLHYQRKHHGGALALRGKRRRKKILAFYNRTYHGLHTERPIVSDADTVCTHVPYEVVTWVQPVLYPDLGVLTA